MRAGAGALLGALTLAWGSVAWATAPEGATLPAAPLPSAETSGRTARGSAWTPALEEAMRRVLVGGCADGLTALSDVAAQGGPAGQLAVDVIRLCTDIKSKAAAGQGAPARVPGPGSGPGSSPGLAPSRTADTSESAESGLDRRGRSRLVPALTLYGVWAGIAFDVLADISGDRAVVLFPLVGMAAGLGGSILATREGEVTTGQAWSIITGLEYGTVSGLLWAGAADASTGKAIVGTGLVTGVVGGGLGLLVARYQPAAGGVEMVRSGGIWGTATALMVALMSPGEPSSQALLTASAIGLDAGILAGAALAYRLPISVNRMLLIDAGALAGLGFGLGGTWLIAGANSHRQLIGGGGLAGLAIGMGVAIFLTRDMDLRGYSSARAPAPALVVRDEHGRFRLGSLCVVPVAGPPGSGRAVVGAAAGLLAGSF